MPAYLDKKTKKWYFQICKTIDGKTKLYKRRGFEKKADALEAERKFLNEFKIKNDKDNTFGDLVSSYLEMKKTDYKETTFFRNQQRITKNIKLPLNDIKIKDLSLNNIIEWKNNLIDKKYCYRYKNRLIFDMKAIIEYGIILYNLNPKLLLNLKAIKINKELEKHVNFWNEDEFNQYINSISNYDHKLLFMTLYYTGLRIGELQALNWNDFYDCKIRVNKTLTNKVKGKGILITPPKTIRSNREILLPDFLNDELLKYKNIKKKEKGFKNTWFIFGGSESFSHTSISRWKNDYCKIAKVKQIRLHDFRHSHASYLINHGADYMIVAERLGHADVSETLNTYSHLFPSRQLEIMNILNKKAS